MSYSCEIQRFLAKFQHIPAPRRFEKVSELYRRATDLRQALPQALKVDSVFRGCEADGLIFFLHAMHYHCAISLHRPFVPLFSRQPVDKAVHIEFIHTCAQIVVQHADAFAKLVETLLSSTNCDLSYIPPLTGFCAFTAASIYATLINTKAAEAASACLKSRLLTNILLLNDMRVYWEPLHRLVSSVPRNGILY